jgi:hypothetical protein
MEITRPNQVWAMDITYIAMARGFVYLAVVLDCPISDVARSPASSTRICRGQQAKDRSSGKRSVPPPFQIKINDLLDQRRIHQNVALIQPNQARNVRELISGSPEP